MSTRTLIKVLLLITGILSVVGHVFEIKVLELYAKPMTVPLLFMLYWFNTKELNWLFILVLFLSFAGDVFLLMEMGSIMLVLLCYLVCYIFLFYFLYKDYKPLRYSKKDIVSIVLIFCLFSIIIYQVYMVLINEVGDLGPYVTVYFLVLYTLFLGSWLQYINIKSKKAFWFVIAIASYIISDICFGIDRFFISAYGLRMMNGVYQLLAVFFLVNYMIANPESLRTNIDK